MKPGGRVIAKRVLTMLALSGLGFLFGYAVWLQTIKLKEAKTLENAILVSVALDRFSLDYDGNYPADPAELISAGYLSVLPTNPFSGQPVKFIHAADLNFEGNLEYIPLAAADQVQGFKLRAYGSRFTQSGANAQDSPDHVLYHTGAGLELDGLALLSER